MKFVFLAKILNGSVCVTAIRKFEDAEWYHFKRNDWHITNHIDIVQRLVGSKNFVNYQQVTVDIVRPINVLSYYDAINDRFFFKDYYLEKGKLTTFLNKFY